MSTNDSPPGLRFSAKYVVTFNIATNVAAGSDAELDPSRGAGPTLSLIKPTVATCFWSWFDSHADGRRGADK